MNFIYCTEGHVRACDGDWTEAVLLSLLLRPESAGARARHELTVTVGELQERLCGLMDVRMLQRSLFGLERRGFLEMNRSHAPMVPEMPLKITVRPQAARSVCAAASGKSAQDAPDWKTLWRC